MSQRDAILAMLKAGRRITPMDALREVGCFRLGARVFELKKLGHDIRTIIIEVGDDKHVAQYHLHIEPVQLDLLAQVAA